MDQCSLTHITIKSFVNNYEELYPVNSNEQGKADPMLREYSSKQLQAPPGFLGAESGAATGTMGADLAGKGCNLRRPSIW